MKLSVVIPAHNEEACVVETIRGISTALRRESIPYEIIVVDDGSTDATAARVSPLIDSERVILVTNEGRHGFGMAVRAGIGESTGIIEPGASSRLHGIGLDGLKVAIAGAEPA